MSALPDEQPARPVVEACLRLGVTPQELAGPDAISHRQAVEVELGGGLVEEGLWRLVLDELDRAMVLALRGAGRPEARCRSCNAPVRWVTTVAGKRMALDPVPHPRGNVTRAPGRKDVVEVHGREDLPIPGGRAYRPHWATCPSAREHRRPTTLSPRCRVCKLPLHRALVELGERTHPCCDPTGEMMR